jgi:hypothetical protein
MPDWAERAYYRLVYPMRARPEITIGGETFAVLDLSERGIRWEVPRGPLPPVGTRFAGRLVLRTAGELDVEGEVVRHDPPDVGATLTRGVPFAVMLDEQRSLTRRLTWSG